MARVLFLQQLPIPRPGVQLLAAVLRQAGHGCEVLVASLERDLAAAARDLEPDLLALSCMTGEQLEALELAAQVRAAVPGVPVVMGGPHATCCPEVVRHPVLDHVCRGEGEQALVELAATLDSGGTPEQIPNLVTEVAGELRCNPLRPLVQELDRLPPPDHQLYRRYRAVGLAMHHPMVQTGRGCPYSCSFCCNHFIRELYGVTPAQQLRRRSPGAVLAELESLLRQHPVQVVEFIDDTFTLQRSWLRRFLPRYRRRIGRPFVCDVRADTLTREVLSALRDAGCAAVRMSVESGNEQIRQQVLGKQLSRQAILRAARLVRSHGIRLLTYNIVGSPGETLEQALETLTLNRQLRPDHAWCALLQPYPGTRVQKLCQKQGLLPSGGIDPDTLPATLFGYSPLGGAERRALESLQRLFHFLVRVPIPLPMVRLLLRRGPGALHDLGFKLSYAAYLRSIEGMSISDLLRAGASGAHQRYMTLGKGKGEAKEYYPNKP